MKMMANNLESIFRYQLSFVASIPSPPPPHIPFPPLLLIILLLLYFSSNIADYHFTKFHQSTSSVIAIEGYLIYYIFANL